MNPLWKKTKEYAKTIGVFLVGVFGPPIVKLFLGETPFPQTRQEWINWLVAIIGSTLAAALTRNKITQGQLDKDPYVLGGKVLDQPVANSINATVNEPWVAPTNIVNKDDEWPTR